METDVNKSRDSELPVPAEQLNDAIASYYPLMWSDEISTQFLNAVGPNGLALVEEIRRFSNDSDHWTYSDHNQAYNNMQVRLRGAYPFLSENSVTRIATSAAWGWR